MIFIVCIVLQSMDFWVVKNVTGRLLVGLRWTNEIMDDGESKWRFDSVPDRSKIDTNESNIFWFGLFGAAIAWAVFALLDILSLNFTWLIIPVMAIALSTSNMYGYYKSRSAHYARLGDQTEAHPISNYTQSVTSSIATKVGTAMISNALSGGGGVSASSQSSSDAFGAETVDL